MFFAFVAFFPSHPCVVQLQAVYFTLLTLSGLHSTPVSLCIFLVMFLSCHLN